jgi:signal transduction histidine kinase
MLIFISFLLGVVFTGFLGIVERFRMSRTINRLQKQIRDLKRELRVQEPPVPPQDVP